MKLRVGQAYRAMYGTKPEWLLIERIDLYAFPMVMITFRVVRLSLITSRKRFWIVKLFPSLFQRAAVPGRLFVRAIHEAATYDRDQTPLKTVDEVKVY